MPNKNDDIFACARSVAERRDSDIFIFTDSIDRDKKDKLINEVNSVKKRRKQAGLILATRGGDPDAAYLIAKFLKQKYTKFDAYIFGLCKSAGTLVTLGASEIIMSDLGELGPLDIQMGKDDEVFKRSSGLDLTESLSHLKELSWDIFKEHFMALKRGSSITTKTAAEIAQALTATIINPIASQVDPLRLGEIQRAMRITRDYAKLLNPSFDSSSLIVKYPSHEFVIDRDQAKQIFKNIREPDEAEIDLANSLNYACKEERAIVMYLSAPEEKPVETNESEHSKSEGNGSSEKQSPKAAARRGG